MAMQEAKEAPPKGAKKVALLLISLGMEASAALLKQLEPYEVQAVSAVLANLGPVPAAETSEIVHEFEEAVTKQHILGCGGVSYTRKLLAGAFGQEYAEKAGLNFPERVEVPPTPLQKLSRTEPEQLARVLESEHPQTVAVLCSQLSPELTSKLIGMFAPETQFEVLTRMASLEATDSSVVELVAASLADRLADQAPGKMKQASGVQMVADLINRLDSSAGAQLLESMGVQAPELADSIRQLLFVFDDILKLDQKSMRDLIARLDRKVLMLGLKGTSEEIRQHFLGVMSKNGASMLLEDMDAAGPVRIREVEGAQQQIITVVRQMESEGLLDLRSAGAEEYVV